MAARSNCNLRLHLLPLSFSLVLIIRRPLCKPLFVTLVSSINITSIIIIRDSLADVKCLHILTNFQMVPEEIL